MATGFPVKANYATGDVLTAANMNDLSGTLNYLQYMPPRNPVLNSAFNVWQRGTSFTIASNTITYTADRWSFYRNATGATITRQVTGDTTNLPNIQYCMRVARDSGNTSTAQLQLVQSFETINSIPFVGKQVTLSFYARKGANYSATSSALTVQLITGTGTDQSAFAYTGTVAAINSTATLTSTWARYTFTATLDATATELAPRFFFDPVGTAGAADYFEITGVQLELGSVANTYMPNQPTYATELAACQRYFMVYGGDQVYERFGGGSSSATTDGRVYAHLPVVMRTTPTMTYSTLTDWQLVLPGVAGVATSAISISSNESSPKIVALTVTIASNASFGGSKAVVLAGNNSTNARINLSAEL